MIPEDRRTMPSKVRRPRKDMTQAVLQLETLGLKVTGSYRREKGTVGDLDILVPPEQSIAETSSILRTLMQYEEIQGGNAKSAGIAMYKNAPLLLNLWRVPRDKAWAAMFLFTTGPYDLNIMMRGNAKGRGWVLSQYGLFEDGDQGKQLDNGLQEADIFRLLNIEYLTPVEREFWRDHLRKTPLPQTQEVSVLSSDGVTYYTVTLKNGKGWDCNCKGFAYRSQCRHLEEAEAQQKRAPQ